MKEVFKFAVLSKFIESKLLQLERCIMDLKFRFLGLSHSSVVSSKYTILTSKVMSLFENGSSSSGSSSGSSPSLSDCMSTQTVRECIKLTGVIDKRIYLSYHRSHTNLPYKLKNILQISFNNISEVKNLLTYWSHIFYNSI